MKVNVPAVTGVLNTVGLAVLAYLVLNWMDGTDRSIERLTAQGIENNNIVKQWVNKSGEFVTKANSNYLTLEQLVHSNNKQLDSLRGQLEGNSRSLDRVTTLWTTASASLPLPIRDTVLLLGSTPMRARRFTFNDNWLDLEGTILDKSDTAFVKYRMKSVVSLEYHWRREGLFKPKTLSLLVQHDNPYMQVDRVQQFTILDQRKFWEKPAVTFGAGVITGLLLPPLFRAR